MDCRVRVREMPRHAAFRSRVKQLSGCLPFWGGFLLLLSALLALLRRFFLFRGLLTEHGGNRARLAQFVGTDLELLIRRFMDADLPTPKLFHHDEGLVVTPDWLLIFGHYVHDW